MCYIVIVLYNNKWFYKLLKERVRDVQADHGSSLLFSGRSVNKYASPDYQSTD